MSDSTGESSEGLEDRFQSGTDIQWGEIASAAVGSLLMVGAMTVVGFFQMLQRAVAGALERAAWFASALISLPFDLGAGVFATGADAFEGSVAMFGAAAFPVSVIIATGSILVVLWGVNRFVR